MKIADFIPTSRQGQSLLFNLRLDAVDLASWQRHYFAEAIDMRMFFHSGWSS
ncbi:hypothetical protein MED121_09995 [Marinomonas sp. MED121]|uniref:hypothetical protein n=1 Tax=Marinomonas sp. MED121 TaxID=314277 RepID=UPI000068FB34|nr:hypothetical protein [Marinomonas sp. MED121]EAQ65043.1 hypothetical protein MED121_09995 [Marinomonas sp. MED121]